MIAQNQGLADEGLDKTAGQALARRSRQGAARRRRVAGAGGAAVATFHLPSYFEEEKDVTASELHGYPAPPASDMAVA